MTDTSQGEAHSWDKLTIIHAEKLKPEMTRRNRKDWTIDLCKAISCTISSFWSQTG
jgi:hypothetical protein